MKGHKKYPFFFIVLLFMPLSALWATGKSGDKESVIIKNKEFDILHPDDIHSVSRPIVYKNGILFTFSMKEAREVYVSGSFTEWRENIELSRNSYGIFYRFVSRKFVSGSYTYRYLVDHVWINDPSQPAYKHDGYGQKISSFTLETPVKYYVNSPVSLGGNRFRFFLKDNGYKYVSWVGSKNAWDPYVDPMTKEDGYWVIELKIYKEKIFYKFYVDGRLVFDPGNPERAMVTTGEYVNFVPIRRGNTETSDK